MIPAIKEKFPRDTKEIRVQMDNESSNITGTEVEWEKEVLDSGLNIKIVKQTPFSPDLKILDLGYFNIIQSL